MTFDERTIRRIERIATEYTESSTLRGKVLKAKNILTKIANLILTANAAPALTSTALSALAEQVGEMEEVLRSIADVTAEEEKQQLQQSVVDVLGPLEARVNWSDEAKAIAKLPDAK